MKNYIYQYINKRHMVTHPAAGRSHFGGHFTLPSQFLLGLVFFFVGGLLISRKMGFEYLMFIPEQLLVFVCAVGSFLGGFYLVVVRVWRPRIIL